MSKRFEHWLAARLARAGRAVVLLVWLLSSACAVGSGAVGTTPTPRQTPAPSSAAPTGAASPMWTELKWSAPNAIPNAGVFVDVVAWHDGYVAVGQVIDGDRYVGAAFSSKDGATWSRSTKEGAFAAIPTRILATSSQLVAFAGVSGPSSMIAWTSSDGSAWNPRPQLTLQGIQMQSVAAFKDVIVGIDSDSNGSRVWRSVDAEKWAPASAPPAHAILRGLFVVQDGVVALGREGEPDAVSGGVSSPGMGRPAAWWSAEGTSWTTLKVEGVDAPGAQLLALFKTTDGYFASGSDATDPSQSRRTVAVWLSTDAHDWRLAGPPSHWGQVASNGATAVIFSPSGLTGFDAWASRDGKQWTPMKMSGDTSDVPGYSTGVGQPSRIDRLFVTTRGVIVLGQQGGATMVWFAEGLPQ